MSEIKVLDRIRGYCIDEDYWSPGKKYFFGRVKEIDGDRILIEEIYLDDKGNEERGLSYNFHRKQCRKLVKKCKRCNGTGEIDLGGCGDNDCCSPNYECDDCNGKGKIPI